MWSYYSLNVALKLRICTASLPLHLHTFRVRSLGIGTQPIHLLCALQWENGFCQVTCKFKLYIWRPNISLFFFIGMRQGSVKWYCNLKWLNCTSPNNKWVWSIGQGKTKVSEKPLCPSHGLSWDWIRTSTERHQWINATATTQPNRDTHLCCDNRHFLISFLLHWVLTNTGSILGVKRPERGADHTTFF
jgi:hypothetical protein